MLDDLNVLAQRDPGGALAIAASQVAHVSWMPQIKNPEAIKTEVEISSVVVAGMGGSALGAGIARHWLRLRRPFEVVKRYNLPEYVNSKTLVVLSSYSGNTEETLSCQEEAEAAGAQIVIIAAGGQLIDAAQERGHPFVHLPAGYQPRMAVTFGLRALVALLQAYHLAPDEALAEIAAVGDWLSDESSQWLGEVATEQNLAKRLAEHTAGKTAVIYAGSRMAPVAYKWKISFNENAKTVAFCNELPEFNHNEFIGWTSHPIEKPFAVFDLMSGFEHPQILKRFASSDRLLSGLRPKSVPVELAGESVIAQMLWGCLLADFVTIYLAILNGVDPIKVDLIEKLKQELR